MGTRAGCQVAYPATGGFDRRVVVARRRHRFRGRPSRRWRRGRRSTGAGRERHGGGHIVRIGRTRAGRRGGTLVAHRHAVIACVGAAIGTRHVSRAPRRADRVALCHGDDHGHLSGELEADDLRRHFRRTGVLRVRKRSARAPRRRVPRGRSGATRPFRRPARRGHHHRQPRIRGRGRLAECRIARASHGVFGCVQRGLVRVVVARRAAPEHACAAQRMCWRRSPTWSQTMWRVANSHTSSTQRYSSR